MNNDEFHAVTSRFIMFTSLDKFVAFMYRPSIRILYATFPHINLTIRNLITLDLSHGARIRRYDLFVNDKSPELPHQ